MIMNCAAILTNKMHELCEATLDAFKFSVCLATRGVILMDDVDTPNKTGYKKCQFLYNTVIKKEMWAELVEALEQSGHHHVVRILQENCPDGQFWPRRSVQNLPNMSQMNSKNESHSSSTILNQPCTSVTEGFGPSAPSAKAGTTKGIPARDLLQTNEITFSSSTEKFDCTGRQGIYSHFFPPEDTKMISLRWLNIYMENLEQIFKHCAKTLQSVELLHVYLLSKNIEQVTPVQFTNLSRVVIDIGGVELYQANFFEKLLFLEGPIVDSIRKLWDLGRRIDLMWHGSRILKLEPQEGLLIVADHDFFNVDNLLDSQRGLGKNLKYFACDKLPFNFLNIPKTIEVLHLSDIYFSTKLQERQTRLRNFSYILSTLTQLRILSIEFYDDWDLSLTDLTKLTQLESMSVQKANVLVPSPPSMEGAGFKFWEKLQVTTFFQCQFQGEIQNIFKNSKIDLSDSEVIIFERSNSSTSLNNNNLDAWHIFTDYQASTWYQDDASAFSRQDFFPVQKYC